jgi:hypothetical protein
VTRCAIHQPQFLPWLGHFQKISLCDVFVFLDTVQFQKNEFQNRNRIPTAAGEQWLTVPVSYRFGDPIKEVRVAATVPWRRKILGTVEHSYKRSPHFATFAPSFRALVEADWPGLSAINMASVRWLMDGFGITTRTVLASELPACSTDRTGRLVDICRHVGATTYVSGALAQHYLEVEPFQKAGIEVVFQNYAHPVYAQLHGGEGFVSHMSALDGLFCVGGGEHGRSALNLN